MGYYRTYERTDYVPAYGGTGIGGAIYLLIGVVVAVSQNYFDHLSTFVEWHTPECAAVVSSSLVDVTSPIGDHEWHRVTGSVSVPDGGWGEATIAFQVATNGQPATVLVDDVTWAQAR